MRIYLDTCCYGRPYDDQSQASIKAETTAIINAVSICETEGFSILGSSVLIMEINNISDSETRQSVMGFYTKTVTETVSLTSQVKRRGKELQASGLRVMDSLHAALSESAEIDYLLTTDVKFERGAVRLGVKTKIINPINFLLEYMKWLQSLM